MTPRTMLRPGILVACVLAAIATLAVPRARAADTDTTTVAELQREAKALAPFVKTTLGKRFVAATADLPHIAPRTVWYDSSRTHYYIAERAAALPDTAKARMLSRTLDETFYYTTRYGSPLAYVRPLEILSGAGLRDVSGIRLMDYGYGTVGHLRLLASLGAEAVGVEVDPLLHELYSQPGDQGTVRGRHGKDGRVTLLHGQYPAEPEITAAAGDGYDLFISKNTLKNGYIHPAQPVDPRRLVHLGVDDTAYVRNLHRILKPGGYALIYNLRPAPAPPDKPYIPWADGHCPFSRAMWEAAGFRVIEFDRNDDQAARTMGHLLGWDKDGGMDLEHDLFAWYTLVQRPK